MASSAVRSFLGRSRQRWLRRRQLVIISSALVREAAAVRAGSAAFARSDRRYLIRRNVHMIEKGLTMQPRRETFAVDYISQTIDAVETELTLAKGPTTPEREWILTVLAEYFEATVDSTAPEIERSRERFQLLREEFPGELRNGPQRVRMQNEEGDLETVRRVAHSRRSVRWFSDTAVPRAALDNAIEIALESPTACNRSPYRFEVFDHPRDVKLVADLAMGTRGYSHQVRGLIVVVGLLDAFFDERDRHLIYIDSSLASMSLLLALESQGIASCIINWPDIPERDMKMRSTLGLSQSERVVMLIAYGYPAPDGLAPFSAKQLVDEVRTFRTLGDRS